MEQILLSELAYIRASLKVRLLRKHDKNEANEKFQAFLSAIKGLKVHLEVPVVINIKRLIFYMHEI